MKKIALPLTEDVLNPNFGYSKFFKLISINDHKIVKEDVISPPFQESELLPAWLWAKGITDVIISEIDYTTVSAFSLHGINVHKGVQVKKSNEIIKEFIHGTLKTDDHLYLKPD